MIGLPDHHLGELAAALVDGELGPAARELALAHLARCDACHAEVIAQRRLKARLGELRGGVTGLPPDLAARLAAIPVDPPPPPWPLTDDDTVPFPRLSRVEPGHVAGQQTRWRRGRRDASLRPDARAAARPGPRSARRSRRLPVRLAVVSGVSVVALGVAAFIAGGDTGPIVVPNVQRLSAEHTSTSGEVPFELPMPSAQTVAFRPVTGP